MRILRRLMDELFTDLEIVVDQLPDRGFRVAESHGFRFCPVIEAPISPGDVEKRIYFIGGPCGGISEVTLEDGAGCVIRIQRRISGFVVVEIRDAVVSSEPEVRAGLLNIGETIDFTDCRGRTVSVTRMRRRVSRPILRRLGVNI